MHFLDIIVFQNRSGKYREISNKFHCRCRVGAFCTFSIDELKSEISQQYADVFRRRYTKGFVGFVTTKRQRLSFFFAPDEVNSNGKRAMNVDW